MTVLDDPVAPLVPSELKYGIVEREQSDQLTVELYIKDVAEETLECQFLESSINLKFQTRNQAFHQEQRTDNVNHFFLWQPALKGRICPAACKIQVRQAKLTITLTKSSTKKWNTLTLPDQLLCPTSTLKTDWVPLQTSTASEPLEKSPTMSDRFTNGNVAVAKKGFVGLDNIGNTCFLNSVLQCLVNTRELKEYFEKQTFVNEMNRNNPLGMGGMCALSFSVILKKLWTSDECSIAPRKLKELIGQKVPQFAGYDQHDAQEFLTFLLDAIHEDMNRIKDKPYLANSDDVDKKTDTGRAGDAWNKHKMRNDSIVVDLLHGQFRSSLQCPSCYKKSVTFDPFVSLSVPIPPLTVVHTVHLFFIDPGQPPEKHFLDVNADTTGFHLKSDLSQRTGIPVSRIEVFDVSAGEIRSFVTDDAQIKNPNFLVAYQLSDAPDVSHCIVMQRLLLPMVPEFCEECRCPLSKPINVSCTHCKAGYCSEACKAHRAFAHTACKHKPKFKHVGIPFLVDLPQAGIVLEQLKAKVLQYIHHSVQVTPAVKREMDQDLDMNSNESMESPEENLNEYFFMKCLQPSGDPAGARFTENSVVTPSTKFLSIDWRCNPDSKVCCRVEEKDPVFRVTEAPGTSRTVVALKDCLELFHEPETLSKDEAWYCAACKEHVQATKQMSIWKLPKILVVHLKRFSFRNSFVRGKVDTRVDFPLFGLDLAPYVTTVTGSTLYDLYGVVNHMGSGYGGHYTACARLPHSKATDYSETDWRLFDDSCVEKMPESDICSKNAYILFYTRREPQFPDILRSMNGTLAGPHEASSSYQSDSASESEDFRTMD